MKELLPRSSVSYQFQAVLTAFYCAATPEGHGYLSVSPDTSRSNAVPSRCLYAEHYSPRVTVTRSARVSCSVFKVHASALVRRLRRGLCFARSSVCCVCLAWYAHSVTLRTGKVKQFFAIFRSSAFYTSERGYSCANCYMRDSTHTHVHARRTGNGCKGVCKAL